MTTRASGTISDGSRVRSGDVRGNHTHERYLHDHVHLNLNVRALAKSATMAINERSNDLISRGRTIRKLGLGQSPFPVPRTVVEALRANAHHKEYLEVQGLRALREAIAHFHEKNDGVHFDADLILVGPGSKELMFLLQVAYYGELVVPTPCWVSYAPQAQIVGHPVHFVSTDFDTRWHLTAEGLDVLCQKDPDRPRIVVLNYPSNPDGLTYSPAELRQIARVARRYNLVLLSDEIYGQLHHEGRHVSIARFYPEGTIVSSGLSKWCGAGGWRLGTFAFPRSLDWLCRAMVTLASETFTSTSAPIQYAAIAAFKDGVSLEEYLAHARRVLRGLGRLCARIVREAGARLHDPEGAFYLFPDFTPLKDRLLKRGIRTSLDLCERLLDEAGVAVLPGSEFGRPPDELTVRIAYVDFDGARALSASQQVPLTEALDDDFFRHHAFKTVEAVEALAQWVAG